MKSFKYIDENNKEVVDVIDLFEFAFDYKVQIDDIIKALKIIQKHIIIVDK